MMLAPDTTIRATANPTVGWNSTRVLIVLLCFVLNMLDGTDLLIMSFIAPVLSETWRVSPERLGVLFAASLAGMAVGCLLIAPLADRYGRRALIIGALLLVVVSMVLSGFSRSVAELMVARLFVGVGVGTIGVSMTAMTAEFAPDAHANFAVGFVQAGYPFGSIITALVAAHLLPMYGWQAMLIAVTGHLAAAAGISVVSGIAPSYAGARENQCRAQTARTGSLGGLARACCDDRARYSNQRSVPGR
jgi:MFS family permease